MDGIFDLDGTELGEKQNNTEWWQWSLIESLHGTSYYKNHRIRDPVDYNDALEIIEFYKMHQLHPLFELGYVTPKYFVKHIKEIL